MRFMRLTTCILFALLFTSNTQADVVISITNEVDAAGTTLDVTVGIADTTGSSVLTNYNIPIALGADPQGFFTLNGLPGSSFPGSFSNFSPNAAPSPPFNFDFTTSDSGAGITLSSTPTDLFTLNFSIDPAAPAGSLRTVEIQRNPTVAGQLQFTLDGTSIDSGSADFDAIAAISNGSVSVPAIPEPSALCGLILGGLFMASRRKRIA